MFGLVDMFVFYNLPMGISLTKIAMFGVIKIIFKPIFII